MQQAVTGIYRCNTGDPVWLPLPIGSNRPVWVGIALLGAMLILTHFITAGVLTLAAGGGAVFGYATRVRQEMRARARAFSTRGTIPCFRARARISCALAPSLIN